MSALANESNPNSPEGAEEVALRINQEQSTAINRLTRPEVRPRWRFIAARSH